MIVQRTASAALLFLPTAAGYSARRIRKSSSGRELEVGVWELTDREEGSSELFSTRSLLAAATNMLGGDGGESVTSDGRL